MTQPTDQSELELDPKNFLPGNIYWDKDGRLEKHLRDKDPLDYDIRKIVYSGNPLGGFTSRKKRVESANKQIAAISTIITQQRIELANRIYQDFVTQYGDAAMFDPDTLKAWLRSYVVAENIKPEHFELTTSVKPNRGCTCPQPLPLKQERISQHQSNCPVFKATSKPPTGDKT